MKKTGLVAVGIVTGIVAEIGSLLLSFSGVNLFHGGQPNLMVNALLPGIGIVVHLSENVPSVIPKVLLVIALVQFPIYGALLGRDYASKVLSRATLAAIIQHLLCSLIAFYGVMLEKQWQTASLEWRICSRTNDSGRRLSVASDQILRNIKWIEQTEGQIQKVRAQKERGIVYSPDPEEGLNRNLASEREALNSLWETYKKAGGEAKSIEDVQVIDPPCGKPPTKPTLFERKF